MGGRVVRRGGIGHGVVGRGVRRGNVVRHGVRRRGVHRFVVGGGITLPPVLDIRGGHGPIGGNGFSLDVRLLRCEWFPPLCPDSIMVSMTLLVIMIILI